MADLCNNERHIIPVVYVYTLPQNVEIENA